MNLSNTYPAEGAAPIASQTQKPLEGFSARFRNEGARQSSSAISKWNECLEYLRKYNSDEIDIPSVDFNDLSEDYLNSHGTRLFDKFSRYMFDISKCECNTATNYLSGVKTAMLRKYQHLKLFEGQWYRDLRVEIQKRWFKDRSEKGEKVQNSAPKMLNEDLEILCNLLLKENDSESVFNRCLMIIQWHVFGRISELNDIKYSDFDLVHDSNNNCPILRVNLSRTKVNVQQDVHVFRDNYKVCPIHALASSAMLRGTSINEHVFRNNNGVTSNNIVTHMNTLLNELYHTWNEFSEESGDVHNSALPLTKFLTSHSLRSGPLNYANYNNNILIHWLVQRGGWAVDGMQTIFNYLAGNTPLLRLLLLLCICVATIINVCVCYC